MTNSIKCPYCGKERIQLVISSTVSHWNLVGRDHNGEPPWGLASSGGVESHYECAGCGRQIFANGNQELASLLDSNEEKEKKHG